MKIICIPSDDGGVSDWTCAWHTLDIDSVVNTKTRAALELEYQIQREGLNRHRSENESGGKDGEGQGSR